MKRSNAAANAVFTAETILLDGGSAAGKLIIYDGTQPATVDTAVTSQTALATITLSDPAFPSPTNGAASASGLPLSDSSADNSGTATWARALDSNDVAVFDYSVGAQASGADIELISTTITATQPVTITAWTHTAPTA